MIEYAELLALFTSKLMSHESGFKSVGGFRLGLGLALLRVRVTDVLFTSQVKYFDL